MASMKSIEKKINELERINVRFHFPNGRDVRGDRQGIPAYKYKRAAKGTMTIADLCKKRLAQNYPGFMVIVTDCEGKPLHGNTKLCNARMD